MFLHIERSKYMVAQFMPTVIEIFTASAVMGFFYNVAAKGINILYNAFTRGELVV